MLVAHRHRFVGSEQLAGEAVGGPLVVDVDHAARHECDQLAGAVAEDSVGSQAGALHQFEEGAVRGHD